MVGPSRDGRHFSNWREPELALAEIDRLVRKHGSVAAAGRALDDRHGYRPRTGQRLIWRILAGQQRVWDSTVDKLSVTL